MRKNLLFATRRGFLAFIAILGVYFLVTTWVSDLSFSKVQFIKFWYYIVSLAAGFGIQIGLYSYLKLGAKNLSSGVVATTGTTSTAAMISCCTHYLVNILPFLGTVGVLTVVAQYQIELFWVGIFFNLLGITYLIFQARKHSAMILKHALNQKEVVSS